MKMRNFGKNAKPVRLIEPVLIIEITEYMRTQCAMQWVLRYVIKKGQNFVSVVHKWPLSRCYVEIIYMVL